ncbi:general substrate transporter [Acaromyces ingoldii]|uniref:General substrate transporter n=1 Tax=Acaromyces ingoldii TaxID=215250 RepID=A0A316YWK8_9BASI|nr:general substrate transporter [Acaromyces ingoldii]PWN92433.1 general substrate transporter [Acaromyces ingoldii]
MSTTSLSQKESRNIFATLTIVFATLGSITYGYCSCIIATMLSQTSFTGYMGLQRATNATQLSGAINALYQVGALFGTLSSGYTSDRFGRRKAIFLACIMVIIGGGLQAGSVHVAMFMAARFITGIGIGNLVTLIPTWQAELSNPHSRGLLVGLHGTFILVGYSSASWIGFGFSYVTNSHVQWRIPLLFQVIPPLILASGIFFVPESPRWLLQQGREAEALAVCKKIRRDSSAPDDGYAIAEFSSMKAQYQYDLTMPSSWASIFSVRSYRRRAFIGFSCLFLAQCTGTQVINNYGPTIYASLGFNAKEQQLLAAGWITAGIPANFISALLMDKTGRVRMMQFGFLATGIALLGTTTSVAVGTSTGNTAALKAAVFFIYLHIATYGSGLDAPTYVYGTEIWPNHLRAKGAAISISGLFVGALILLMGASTAFATIGWKYYLVFLVMTVIAVVVSLLFYVEVNGLSLEQTAKVFGDHVEVPEVHVYKEDSNSSNSQSDIVTKA